MISIDKKLKILRKKYNFKHHELVQIKKMYSGDFFNPNDYGYRKLIKLSHFLCNKYNKIDNGGNFLQRIIKKIKKHLLIKQLFLGSGFLADVGKNIDVVIGLVDYNGCGFINKNVKFSKYALVSCGNYVMFGNNITVGDSEVTKQNGLIKLGTISIGDDCWVCAGVKIHNNVVIGNKCVVAAGCVVDKNIQTNSLAIGRPCKVAKTLKNETFSLNKINFSRSDKQLNDVKNHFKKLKLNFKNKQLQNLLNCKRYNSINLGLKKYINKSHTLSEKYNKTNYDKNEILAKLFCNHGKNLVVDDDLFIDTLGTIKVGDNVNISKGFCASGNLIIGDNVKIGKNVSMYATGHSLNYKQRRVGFSFKNGLYEFSQSNGIIIKNNVKIGNNCVIAPNTIISKDIPDNCLVVGDNKIFAS